MKNLIRLLLFSVFLAAACDEEVLKPAEEEITEADSVEDKPNENVVEDPVEDTVVSFTMYFPPADSNTWEKLTPDTLKWNTDSLNQLLDFVRESNSNAFIILFKGRIVTEKYWNDWTASTKDIIASAGKTVTSLLVGVAQEEKLLDINHPTSDYLGKGWTSLPEEKENLITILHHLSMTTGLDEKEDMCTNPECLKYVADAGSRWAYHNGSYNILNKVIEAASGLSIDDYSKAKLADRIGLRNWKWQDNILSLSARDMARFGLLILNNGIWDQTPILNDSSYIQKMVTSSNDFNKAYGYLWWVNGQESFMIPGDDTQYSGSLVPSAPADMFAAMGKGDKKIYVVPSMDLIVVRHGQEASEETFGPSSFDNELWKRMRGVLGYEL